MEPADLEVGVGRRPSSLPSGSPPDCPHCRASLESSARMRTLAVPAEPSGGPRAFTVI